MSKDTPEGILTLVVVGIFVVFLMPVIILSLKRWWRYLIGVLKD